jgi:hypothetical protein
MTNIISTAAGLPGHLPDNALDKGLSGKVFDESNSRNSALVSDYYSRSSLSLVEGAGLKLFARSMESSLSIRFSSQSEAYYSKEVAAPSLPTPLDVAKNILGFVRGRLESEVENGADPARVSQLMAQAQEGVSKGFNQAKDDIEALGLMTEELSKQMSDGFDLIGSGLKEMRDDFSADTALVNSTTLAGLPMGSIFEVAASSVSRSESSVVSSSRFDATDVSAYRQRSSSSERADFQLTTRDGDQISIRFASDQASEFSAESGDAQFAFASSSGLQVTVNGDLDEKELEAVNQLLAQVDEISSLFFQERFQEAFEVAMTVGFDASEIAGFSLDLSKMVYQEVQAYGAGEQSAGNLLNRFKPISEMANYFEGVAAQLNVFDSQLQSFKDLLNDVLQRNAQDVLSADSRLKGKSLGEDLLMKNMKQFELFSSSLLDKLTKDA